MLVTQRPDLYKYGSIHILLDYDSGMVALDTFFAHLVSILLIFLLKLLLDFKIPALPYFTSQIRIEPSFPHTAQINHDSF